MKVQIEGPGSVSLETKNENTLEIDTKETNAITLESSRGEFKIYERQGELEIAYKGRIVWSSYDSSSDTWKDWGPPPATKKSK